MSIEIKRLVADFNKSWQEKDLAGLNNILHEEVAFLAPDLKTILRGREACVKTIEDYINKAVTNDFQISIDTIHIVDQSAWLTLSYDIDYEINDQRYKEHGAEIWGLIRCNSLWLLVWRCLVKNEDKK